MPLQSWFPNWVTGLLIYCVSKLNWRTDAWLQCNKNKVPLLNSLTCFIIIIICYYCFIFLPHMSTPAQSLLMALTVSQQGVVWLQVWIQVHRHQRGFWRSWVLLQTFVFSKGRSVALLWPCCCLGYGWGGAGSSHMPKWPISLGLSCWYRSAVWNQVITLLYTRSWFFSTIPAHSGVFICC